MILTWSSPSCCGHLGSELTRGRPFYLPTFPFSLFNFAFQINEINILKRLSAEAREVACGKLFYGLLKPTHGLSLHEAWRNWGLWLSFVWPPEVLLSKPWAPFLGSVSLSDVSASSCATWGVYLQNALTVITGVFHTSWRMKFRDVCFGVKIWNSCIVFFFTAHIFHKYFRSLLCYKDCSNRNPMSLCLVLYVDKVGVFGCGLLEFPKISMCVSVIWGHEKFCLCVLMYFLLLSL